MSDTSANSCPLEYTCCNEDSRSEVTALRLQGRRVLSIAAAGGRAISLLYGDPREVVAVDANYQQFSLCWLKYHAIRHLNREGYLAFVGIAPAPAAYKLRTYDRLRDSLPDGVRDYWDSHRDFIEQGLIYAGSFDRHIILLSKVFRLTIWSAYRGIANCSTLPQQIRYLSVAGSLRYRLWQTLFKLMYNPKLAQPMHLDAGSDESRRTAAGFFFESMRSCLRTHLFSDCFQLKLFTEGRLKKNGPLPFHLESGHYETIRRRLDRLSFRYSEIGSFLDSEPAGSFDAFSLSDLSSYLSSDQLVDLLAGVERTASDGALICLREYIAPVDPRVAWPKSLKRDAQLEAKLSRMDRVLGYTFVCAKVDR
ncbi:MAG: DUF3419 family protein [Actinobacteria bacterium]|nr:DUF3419 family protein [Actinomycetota bacterium]